MPNMQALCLTGPTASGKSAVALALAGRVPVEIISADSALVYRGMDVGTAKPTLAERAAVPHHLIDIRDPSESYSAAEFVRDANRLMQEIRARGRLPLLVGGTMLYIKALLHGLDDLPAADPALRQQLEQQAAERGWPALHAELARVDPTTAARLAPLDSQRIQRALEIWHLTGTPLSRLHALKKEAAEPPPIPVFSIEPQERAWLHERIARRFDAMLEQGFLDEVAALRARGDLSPALPSIRCVGYRQAWQALQEGWPPDELRARAIAATRQLCKRQLTWLRAMPNRRVLPAQEENLVDRLKRFWLEC
ncbi:MAG: tRNA (adenosine(37)-N6)-dimethylallyltransferase MiaA [Burkholderiaceae bacterium]|nr:tRNA (adenosine(37)-N6)-dimethylallyltransferase MiaA [Burkholderiaceae bacterium]